MFALFATVDVRAESFDELVGVDKTIEIDRIESIVLTQRSFSDTEYSEQYVGAVEFFAALKTRLVSYYTADRISYYRIYDIILDLETLRDDLDTYFLALAAYDASGNDTYRQVAEYKRIDVRASYQRLVSHLGTSLKSSDEGE